MKYLYNYSCKICNLFIYEENEAISNIYFKKDRIKENFIVKETVLLKNTAKQLDEYFTGKRKKFDIPLNLKGTEFQVKVWEALKTIPYGETRSYGELAARIGNPKACRAVGMANNHNPVSIIIPCHRVIGCKGSLTGYAGGLKIKQQLLELEKNT